MVADILQITKSKVYKIICDLGISRTVGEGVSATYQHTHTLSIKIEQSRERARRKVQRYLGRKLETWEDVHHKDENPLNNNIDNLQVLSHGDHTRLHKTGNRKCGLTGCDRKHAAKGLCKFHWQRRYRGHSL